MPELPEVETVARGLARSIVGEKIVGVSCSRARIFISGTERIERFLTGQVITGVNRRAKYLVLEMSRYKLVIHLGMSGGLFAVCSPGIEDSTVLGNDPHVHLKISFASGGFLFLRDPRMFGRVILFEGEGELARFFERLGIEPLSADFNYESFRRILQGRKGMIKPFLMDQSQICGLGNIYADEALFLSGIHPETRIPALTQEKLRKLCRSIPEVLKLGIKYGGTSFRDYRNAQGGLGSFQEKLKVYGRNGLECRKCRSILEKIQVGGRSSHYCPACQRKAPDRD